MSCEAGMKCKVMYRLLKKSPDIYAQLRLDSVKKC